jgi:hypothetical protein
MSQLLLQRVIDSHTSFCDSPVCAVVLDAMDPETILELDERNEWTLTSKGREQMGRLAKLCVVCEKGTELAQ